MTDAVRAVSGVRIIGLHSDPDHDRSVLTFAGEEDAVLSGAIILAKACASELDLDRSQIITSDVSLFVLDGRVPDEGACVDLGIAYCHKSLKTSEKLLVGLHTDSRASFLGVRLNPMVRIPLDYATHEGPRPCAFPRFWER